MNVSLASTSEYTVKAAESISDLSPNAADVLITSVVTAMVTELGVCSPTSAGLLTFHDGARNIQHTIDGYFISPNSFRNSFFVITKLTGYRSEFAFRYSFGNSVFVIPI